jgi:hypothetical protein
MNARRPSGLFLAIAAAIALAQLPFPGDIRAEPATNALVRTLSASRQFVVYANSQLLPSALCVYAEHGKRAWLQLLGMTDGWRDPILIMVRPREPSQANEPAVSLELIQTGERFKYQISCFVPPPLDETELLAAIVEALCAERANRDQRIVAGRAFAAPRMPRWLVEGIAASIQGRGELLMAVARRSLAAGRPQSAGDLLSLQRLPSDPADRALVRANAWMFTESLLGLPDGARRLAMFLAQIGTQKMASNAFWTVYGREFTDEAALEKWWNLQRTIRTSVVVAEDLTARDTGQQLDAILLTRLEVTSSRRALPPDRETTVDQLWRYYDEPWLPDVLEMKINRLGALRGEAHPLYRPVIDHYLDALGWLRRQSTVRFRRELRKAEAARIAAEKQSRAIAAYMDQAERVYAPDDFSRIFTGYFQTLDQFQKLEDERRNPISDYLDKFDH